MKKFKSISEIPVGCIVAPSLYFAPRTGAQAIGKLNGTSFFRAADVSELRMASEWK